MLTTNHSRLLGIVGGALAALSLSTANAQFDPPYYPPCQGCPANPPNTMPNGQERGPWSPSPNGGPNGNDAQSGPVPPPWARFQGYPRDNGGSHQNGYQNNGMGPPNPYAGGYGPPPWATPRWIVPLARYSGPNGEMHAYAYGSGPIPSFRTSSYYYAGHPGPYYPRGYTGPMFSPTQPQPQCH